jgi:hypothetical protein
MRDLVIISDDGRGESNDKDFMRIKINRPLNSSNNQIITLSVTQGGNLVHFWLSRAKTGGKISLPKTFKCKDLPIDLYVEAINHSNAVRDIEIKLQYLTNFDIVKATAIWVQCPNSWHTRCPSPSNPQCDQALNNPMPGQGILSNLDQDGLKNQIISVRNSKDGSRFGHGYNGVIADNGVPHDDHFGGRILFEFSVLPTLSASDYEDLGVSFDCTRRRNIRTFSGNHGEKPGVVLNEPFPAKLDYANDDNHDNIYDEDNVPTNGFLYSWDAPGYTNIYSTNSKKIAFKASKFNFEEFVRVEINGSIPNVGANGLFGSRASEKINWHMVAYTKSGPGYIIEPDESIVSYSQPLVGINTGNGIIAVELLSAPQTDGYKLNYLSGGKWRMKSSTTEIEVAESGGKWVLIDNNKVKVTITKGNTPFYPGDSFKFSVFKTEDNKLNETAEGSLLNIDKNFAP